MSEIFLWNEDNTPTHIVKPEALSDGYNKVIMSTYFILKIQ